MRNSNMSNLSEDTAKQKVSMYQRMNQATAQRRREEKIQGYRFKEKLRKTFYVQKKPFAIPVFEPDSIP